MRAALAFLTPLPVGGPAPDRRTLRWFPLAGALVGAAVGGAWWAAAEAFPPLVAAAVAVAVDLLLTGALHVDGLADSADGLLPPLDGAERRKAVMRQPDVGAFGAAAVTVVLLLRWSALASMGPDVALVAALWAASRTVMAVALVTVRYVGGGLGTAFLGTPVAPLALAAVASVGVPILVTDDPVVALAATAAGILGASGVVALGRRRIGGVTGDVVGAAGLVAETIGLVVATARW